jgi:hypothetical protein
LTTRIEYVHVDVNCASRNTMAPAVCQEVLPWMHRVVRPVCLVASPYNRAATTAACPRLSTAAGFRRTAAGSLARCQAKKSDGPQNDGSPQQRCQDTAAAGSKPAAPKQTHSNHGFDPVLRRHRMKAQQLRAYQRARRSAGPGCEPVRSMSAVLSAAAWRVWRLCYLTEASNFQTAALTWVNLGK